MSWIVEFHPLFAKEYLKFSKTVQDKLLEEILMLEEFGSQLGRPIVDTLNSSQHSNMKELRFNADNGVWRTAFAFDPERKAILLVAGDKSGGNQKRFYKQLLKKADQRFSDHLQRLKENDTLLKEKFYKIYGTTCPLNARRILKPVQKQESNPIAVFKSYVVPQD